MDKSALSASLFNTKSPFSPRSRQNISSRRSVGGSGFRKSSRVSLSGRSVQSVQVVFKSQWNSVERFGQPLPVLVTEALTFADRNTVVSARISSECGYAWLVCGRRLLIWQYRQSPVLVQPGTPRRGGLTNQCYELQLPQSDLAHRAELISIFLNSGSTVPSCIAVSPEGVVRYWPAVAHEEVSIEQLIDLQGQECDSLTGIEGLGCILATTTCTIVLVQPQLSSGRHLLTCHTLKLPSGWLGGLSKKVSSLIFGPINAEQTAETRLVRILAVPKSENVWIVYVLSGHSVQKWQLSSYEPEQLIYICDLSRIVKDGFFGTIWENCGGDQSDTDTWILDLQADNDNITLLTAAVNMHLSPQIHYAMVSIDTYGNQPPSQFSNFLVLKMSGLYREDNPSDTLGYRFLLSGNYAYIYNHRCITVIKPQEEPDCLEFNSPQDFLLGGSICVNTPVFFSRNDGLVAITSNDLASEMNLSVMSSGTPVETSFADVGRENLTLYNFNPDEMYAAYKDTEGQFKAAFIFHMKSQFAESNDILNELFLTERASLPGIDTVLDKVVICVSQDLLNDIPANDPRWLGQNQVGLGSSYSMQVLEQLTDKKRAQLLFIKFLKDAGLWKNLFAITHRGAPMATVHLLAENVEKVVAAISLKNLPYEETLQKAIEKAIINTQISIENGLTHQDIFYRETWKVYRVIQELVINCEDAAHSDRNPLEVAKYLSDTNVILLAVLKEIMFYRQQNIEQFTPSDAALALAPDYLPWTSASGDEGLMNSLLSQQNLTYNYGGKMVNDPNLRSTLYEQLVSLIDFILDGRKSHLESIRDTQQEHILLKQYQTDRKKLISPLIEDKEWEGATALAEKYLDFESLIIICEKTNNQPRLDEYMDRFSNEDFANFVYNWYLQQNKQGKLLEYCHRKSTTQKTQQQLRNFLSQHPSLSWIQNAFDKNYQEAAEILRDLAEQEMESVTRQKTMLSMSKMAKLAVEKKLDDPFVENINTRLELIAYQEELPDYVLQQFGYNTIQPRVISPKDLIHLYICPEHKDATELEFKKALDLLSFISDDEIRNDFKLKIWKSAILRDTWDEKNLDSPLDVLQNKLLFKTVDLALVLGADPYTLLPPLDSLTEDSDLINLQDNKSFQFLIKAGYEHITKVMQS